jgi:hypothetical protein
MSTIQTLNQHKISPAFIKANGFLIEKYKLEIEPAVCKNKKLEDLWLTEFNAALKFNDKLHLSGNDPPTSGAFNEGDIVWNNYPQPGKFVGWVCVKSGSPGMWNGFGRIE